MEHRGRRRRSPHPPPPYLQSEYYYSPPAKPQRLWWTRTKDFCRQLTAFLFSHVGVCVLVIAYAVIGGWLFPAIESSVQPIVFHDLIATRKNVTETMWRATMKFNVFDRANWSVIVTEEIKKYTQAVVDAAADGYDGTDVKDVAAQWSFYGSFLYSLAVMTTIGYGNLAPRTISGKFATIFYGLIGMPLFLLYLSNIGDFLAAAFRWLYARCCLCQCRSKKPKHNRPPSPSSIQEEGTAPVVDIPLQAVDGDEDDKEEVEEEEEEVAVPIHVCLVLMVTYVVGGARLFAFWEDWDLLDGSYFCFISLSTIGFGDLVPGDKIYATTKPGENAGDRLPFVFCSLYLLVGMALIAMCFNLMQEQVVRGVKNCLHKVSCSRDKSKHPDETGSTS